MHWETWLPGNNKKNSIQLGGNEANKMQAGYKHKYVLFSWELVANNNVAHILNFKLIFATGPNHNKSYEEEKKVPGQNFILLSYSLINDALRRVKLLFTWKKRNWSLPTLREGWYK